jgi:hypothetical protein
MSLAVKSSDDFTRLVAGLASDVVDAKIHLTLLTDIWLAQDEYEREFAQSRTFWSLTTRAHGELGIYKLARVYDGHHRGLNLSTWLGTIRDNQHLFNVENFRERLRDNPFVDSLSEKARVPDHDVLDADIGFVSSDDPRVAKLLFVRNNLLAHRSAKLVLQDRDPFKEQGFSFEDCHLLADRAVDILNRYSSLFSALTFSTQPVGQHDFVGMLALIRKGVECLEDEYRKEAEDLDTAI